jgi:hypothetical protein
MIDDNSDMVPQAGIEPTHPAYKTGPLPLRIQGHFSIYSKSLLYTTFRL